MNANIHELSLAAPEVNTNPGEKYFAKNRKWQGIPGIERTKGGIIYATWYTGGTTEGPDNYVVIIKSCDEGKSWSKPILVIDPTDKVRAYDECLWIDPLGRMWFFWTQSYTFYNGRAGVWAIRCDDPEADKLSWTEPRRICNGIMMNKPIVTSKGEWMLPAAVWNDINPRLPELEEERRSNVVVSSDQGKTWQWRGGADVPHRHFDEHMVVEKKDGSLWVLVRTHYGIGQSTSADGGKTWEPGRPTDIAGPCSRFHIRRLKSGRLLLINHFGFTGRSHMCAMLSDNDGESWSSPLLLDERKEVSYPDASEAEDGMIYTIYDRDRYGEREILMAVFNEEDILAGKCVSEKSQLKVLVDKIPGESNKA